MRLIDNWHRKLHKLWTTRLASVGFVVGLLAENVTSLQGVLPDKWYLAIFLLIFVLRLVAQPEAHDA